MSFQITTPVSGKLRITQTMWEDFLCNPVLAARVIMGIELDAFQAARLRYYWWVKIVIDSSGFSSGKTIVDFLFACLRAILIPDQWIGVYYPVFDTGKQTFWNYFDTIKHPIFRGQMGRIEEDEGASGKQEEDGFFKAHFRNGSHITMPAPSFNKGAFTQASLRFNTIIVEEWTHIDAGSTGIDDQLIGRTTRQSFNQFHPIWGNHILLTAPAKNRRHPGFRRFDRHQKKVDADDPDYANLHYCYKDYSDIPSRTGKSFRDEYRNMSTIELRRTVTDAGEWLGEGFGLWGLSGASWFPHSSLEAAQISGAKRGLVPVFSREEMIQAMNEASRAAGADV
jgi:hypothetical protein